MRQWQFSRDAADQLARMLPEDEQKIHPIDPRVIDWDSYFESCVLGIRKYIHKDKDTDIKKARRQMQM